jgi:hypothetical protein
VFRPDFLADAPKGGGPRGRHRRARESSCRNRPSFSLRCAAKDCIRVS